MAWHRKNWFWKLSTADVRSMLLISILYFGTGTLSNNHRFNPKIPSYTLSTLTFSIRARYFLHYGICSPPFQWEDQDVRNAIEMFLRNQISKITNQDMRCQYDLPPLIDLVAIKRDKNLLESYVYRNHLIRKRK